VQIQYFENSLKGKVRLAEYGAKVD
jgi:hypothetical protein